MTTLTAPGRGRTIQPSHAEKIKQEYAYQVISRQQRALGRSVECQRLPSGAIEANGPPGVYSVAKEHEHQQLAASVSIQAEGLIPPPGNGRRALAVETPWRKFIRLHMNTLVACDFFTKNIITPIDIRTAYCLFFIHLQTRKVFMCPATYHPNRQWMMQQARNVQMWMEDEGIEARFLLRDRDTKFAPAFGSG